MGASTQPFIRKEDQIALFEELKGRLFGYNIQSVSGISGVHMSTIYNRQRLSQASPG